MNDVCVLVADDEPLARRRLIRLLKKLNWVARIEEASDTVEARKQLMQVSPDILLLDIQVPGGSGFDVLADLPSDPPIVIFVTAFDTYALKAFEANAMDYLTKPVESGRFYMAMERARSALSLKNQADRISELQEVIHSLKGALRHQTRQHCEFWVKQLGEFIRIQQEQIIRFQAERDYVRIHIQGASYLYQETLNSLESRLDSDEFVRIHRSCIVKKSAIVRVKRAAFSALIVMLADGAEVRVGRTYAASVMQTLLSAS